MILGASCWDVATSVLMLGIELVAVSSAYVHCYLFHYFLSVFSLIFFVRVTLADAIDSRPAKSLYVKIFAVPQGLRQESSGFPKEEG